MRRCDRCEKEARYLVGIRVEVMDLKGERDRLKRVTVALCEECEGASRIWLQKDAGQRKRIAEALCQEHERAGKVVFGKAW